MEEDEQEAEAYWGMILSEYGIEYVEDPNTHKRIPTCHRTHMQNIRSSTNYQLAIKYADAERRFMYQDEAEALDKLQRTILSVSSKIEPYDVFISYKESGDDGQRTADSVLAQEIYDALETAGVRTFFSRVSLEEHLGENYEPYIYAALTSAKVMLVVATQAEHCDSVWVRNEWSRFIGFMDQDASKSMIPVYKDMTPYDFPMELSSYQAQDMSKVGAIQDLVRGVRKLLGKTPKQAYDATINELIADKKEREEQKYKRKKRAHIIYAIIAVMAFLAGLYFAIFVQLPKYIYREKATEVEHGTANPEDYNTIIVTVTLDNYDEYFELTQVGDSEIYVLRSKIKGEGWYYFTTKSFRYDVKWGTTSRSGGGEVFPFWISTEPNEKPVFTEFNATVVYVNENIVKEYSQETAYRKIVLKNGNYRDMMGYSTSDGVYLKLGEYDY